jgi:hypothetical protein
MELEIDYLHTVLLMYEEVFLPTPRPTPAIEFFVDYNIMLC